MKDSYWELTITMQSDYVEFIADFVANISGEGLEIGGDHIIVRSENEVEYIQDAVQSLVGTLGGAITPIFKIEEKENIDWIQQYQNSIQPIAAGKFYIYPSWFEPRENMINIMIDPALAFGSGHHATTYSCLEAISQRVESGQRILDVGCGSGILGLACSSLEAKVELCDTDPLSIASSKSNFELNNLAYEKIWEGSANKAEGVYDVVIANIIADVLKIIALDLKKATKIGGTLILSGILDKKLSSVLPSFIDMKLIDEKQQDEWVTLVYRKDKNEQF